MKVLIINGANLNKQPHRDHKIYGENGFDFLENYITKYFKKEEIEMVFTNFEGQIIEFIHKAQSLKYDAIIINPGAYAHYSYAIADALEIYKGIKVEVHLSDVFKRETWRQNLVTAKNVDFLVTGRGILGYIDSLNHIKGLVENE